MPRLALPFLPFPGLLALSLAGCSQSYSPNTYASTAVQQEATVKRGLIIGVRPVLISADGTIGAAAGGAVGGVAGAQVPGGPVTTTLGAVGGAVLGGLGGAVAEQAVANAKGWEYIVQETGGTLVSVTQTSKVELPIGLHVLVIDGKQARIVPDYTVQIAAAGQKPAVTNSTKTSAASNDPTATEVYVSPILPAAGVAAPFQVDPITVPSNPIVPPAPSPSAGSAVPPGASSSTPPASSSSTATP